jgi:serine/threonine protein kinase
MGEVYRALDTRLGRHVAIKVLPASTASSPEYRQRLEREARAVSSLSHPNICALYDVGHQDGIDFLVMEFLEGETLADRLARGPLPLDQALKTGIEIADALQGAHRKGIVHRDLKPGNIMLTRTGARLLDFGLAKPIAAAPRGAGLGETVSGALTAEGTFMGTFQYMSPEQVEGKEADARSDVFALGALLHEMLTGQRAFDGKTPASVIGAILEREPSPVSSLQPLSPKALDDIVRGCLAKDPDERWQTAHDVKLQLQSVRARTADVTEAMPTRRRNLRETIAWGLALTGLVAAVALGTMRGRTTSPAPSMLRASLLPPPGHSFVPNDFAISPDGRRMAFVAAGADGVPTLWVQPLDSSQAVEVAGTTGASSPFWSPDSRWVAFFSGTNLMKVEPGGAGIQRICDVNPDARYGAWGAQDVIVFSSGVLGPLVRVPAAGGTATPATSVPAEAAAESHRFPQFLPDGKRFLYVASWTNEQRGGIYLASVDGGPPELVSSDIRGRVVLTKDQLLYVRKGVLLAQSFDPTARRLTGTPRSILQNEIVVDWRFGEVPLTASQNGTLVFQSRLSYNTQLVWYDRSGHEQGTVGLPGFSAPALSPKGGRYVAVAYDSAGIGQQNLWIYDLLRNISTPLTTSGIDTAHNWSPDGRWILFSSIRNQNGIHRRLADGSGTEETFVESPAHLLVNAYAPDGGNMLYMNLRTGQPYLQRHDFATKRDEPIEGAAEASYSPDGKWIASIGAPTFALMIRPAGGGGRIPISNGPGGQPRWRLDGKEIFYIASDKKLMAVEFSTKNGTLEPGPPKALFQTRIVRPSFVLFQYDVTADGQRFLINSLPREDAAAPLTILSNWTEVAKR